jgi:hypothetical protein
MLALGQWKSIPTSSVRSRRVSERPSAVLDRSQSIVSLRVLPSSTAKTPDGKAVDSLGPLFQAMSKATKPAIIRAGAAACHRASGRAARTTHSATAKKATAWTTGQRA